MSATESSGITGWAVRVIEELGELGVGALVAIESVFPPIPSEIVLPFAGFTASQGTLDPILTWIAATLGALFGALVLYGVGAFIGAERAHRLAQKPWFILFSEKDLIRGERFFDRHGSHMVLFGRCLPFIRSVVSVPAGFRRMPLPLFATLTAIGSGAWNMIFIYAGYRLGNNWHDVRAHLEPVGSAIGLALTVGAVLLGARRIIQRRREVQQVDTVRR